MRKIPDSYVISTFDGEEIVVDVGTHAHIERMVAQGQKFVMINGEGVHTSTFKRIRFVPGREIMEAGDLIPLQLEPPKKTEKQLKSEYRAYCQNLEEFERDLLSGKIYKSAQARDHYHAHVFRPMVSFEAFCEEEEKAQKDKRPNKYLTEFWWR